MADNIFKKKSGPQSTASTPDRKTSADAKPSPIEPSSRIDASLRASGYGGRGTIYQESAFGINFINNGQMVQPNRVNHGICFFTRPLLNLTYDNLNRGGESFLPYRDSEEWSYARMAKVLLDPLNQRAQTPPVKDGNGYYYHSANTEIRDSPLVNALNPFIPILTNNLINLSGYQDSRLDHYASDKGIRNEQWIMADGHVQINEAFTLDATFSNPAGDPILLLFDLWLNYMSCVRTGEMFPYPEMLAYREIDYMTRIYNFSLDEHRRYIVHHSAIVAGFPTNVPNGKIHDFDATKQWKDAVNTININFQCMGCDYNSPTVLHEFNELVAMFNPHLNLYSHSPEKHITDDLRDNIPKANIEAGGNNSVNAQWLKLLPHEKQRGNYHAYPLINVYTKELEWWIHKDSYIKYVLGANAHASSRMDDVTTQITQQHIEKRKQEAAKNVILPKQTVETKLSRETSTGAQPPSFGLNNETGKN